MPATRLQAKAHIATKITDPKNYQNTAALVREVLEYVMLHCFVLAEDQLTIAQVTDLAATLSNKADLVAGKVPPEQLPAFSTFWGTMAKAADNAQTVEQAIAAAVAAVVNASPAQLDTLNELAAALGNDANFSATITAALAAKIPSTEKGAANGVATLDATGKVPASQLPASTGGTGATVEQARSQSATLAPSSKLLDDELSKTDAFRTNASSQPTHNGQRVVRFGEAPTVDAANLAAMAVGQTNLFTVTKQADGSALYTSGIEQLDKLGANTLQALLQDSAAWQGQQLVLNGTNTAGQLGQNSQEFYYKRRWYLCIAATANSATWLRNSMVNTLNAADSYDLSIINQLKDETGWNNNLKSTTVKAVNGDCYTDEVSGYVYHCYSDDNKWRRVSEPATDVLYIEKTGNYTALCTALEAHDFTASSYNANGLANPNLKGSQGQKYYVAASRSLFECVTSAGSSFIWEKLR